MSNATCGCPGGEKSRSGVNGRESKTGMIADAGTAAITRMGAGATAGAASGDASKQQDEGTAGRALAGADGQQEWFEARSARAVKLMQSTSCSANVPATSDLAQRALMVLTQYS